MRIEYEPARRAAQAVGTDWAEANYRSAKEREFAASCVRVAILNVLHLAPDRDALEVMSKDPIYRRVFDKFAPDLEGLCADALTRYHDEL